MQQNQNWDTARIPGNSDAVRCIRPYKTHGFKERVDSRRRKRGVLCRWARRETAVVSFPSLALVVLRAWTALA